MSQGTLREFTIDRPHGRSHVPDRDGQEDAGEVNWSRMQGGLGLGANHSRGTDSSWICSQLRAQSNGLVINHPFAAPFIVLHFVFSFVFGLLEKLFFFPAIRVFIIK
jgi:hypothetical protein